MQFIQKITFLSLIIFSVCSSYCGRIDQHYQYKGQIYGCPENTLGISVIENKQYCQLGKNNYQKAEQCESIENISQIINYYQQKQQNITYCTPKFGEIQEVGDQKKLIGCPLDTQEFSIGMQDGQEVYKCDGLFIGQLCTQKEMQQQPITYCTPEFGKVHQGYDDEIFGCPLNSKSQQKSQIDEKNVYKCDDMEIATVCDQSQKQVCDINYCTPEFGKLYQGYDQDIVGCPSYTKSFSKSQGDENVYKCDDMQIGRVCGDDTQNSCNITYCTPRFGKIYEGQNGDIVGCPSYTTSFGYSGNGSDQIYEYKCNDMKNVAIICNKDDNSIIIQAGTLLSFLIFSLIL